MLEQITPAAMTRPIDAIQVGQRARKDMGAIDQKALVTKLATFKGGAAGLLGIARALADMSGRPVHHSVAATIVDQYNKRRRTGQLEAWDSTTKKVAE